jgi:hypothetical protein
MGGTSRAMPILQRRSRASSICLVIFLCLSGYVLVWGYVSLLIVSDDGRREQASIMNDGAHMAEQKTLIQRQQRTSIDTKTDRSSFSACLLVMDDNHFLIERLAYHYHVLPLRHLIVAVDPRSQTSPNSVLQRWKNTMNITIWSNDNEYMNNATELAEAEEWVATKFTNDKPSPALIRHRVRQRLFYYHCLQEHKSSGRSYTLLTDSDEYLTVNYDTVKAVYGNNKAIERIVAPPISEPGSILKLLGNERYYHPDSNFTNQSPCVQIPRSRFGAVESPGMNLQALVPTDFNLNASQFTTLRWQLHADPLNYQQNRISKVILDVSRVPDRHFRPVDSIHRPVKQYCKRRKLHIRAHQQLLLIHHYLGSWEQYGYRQDPRAGNERSRKVSVCNLLLLSIRLAL